MSIRSACSVALLALLLLATSTAALRFRLHHDEKPTCIEMEVNEFNQGGTVRIRYTNNMTTISRQSGDHVALQYASDLRVQVYIPSKNDGVSENERKLDTKSIHTYKPSPSNNIERAKVHSFHVDPSPRVLSTLFGGSEPTYGNYEVCFSFVPSPSFISLFSKHNNEEGLVTVDTFAGDVITEHISLEKGRQFKSAEGKDSDHLPEADMGLNKKATHDRASKIHTSHLDTLVGDIHNIQRLLKESTRDAEDLQRRHRRFRETSEDSFTRVWGFSLLTMVIMAASCFRQYFAVRNTIKAKKLV